MKNSLSFEENGCFTFVVHLVEFERKRALSPSEGPTRLPQGGLGRILRRLKALGLVLGLVAGTPPKTQLRVNPRVHDFKG